MLVQLGSRVIWCCKTCRLGTSNYAKLLLDVEETCKRVTQTVNAKIDRLDNSLVRSYADVAASEVHSFGRVSTSNGARNTSQHKNYHENKPLKTYIVKPKKLQSNQETRDELQKLVNPADIFNARNQYKNEDLNTEIKQQNSGMNETDYMNIIYQKEIKPSQWMIVVEVTPQTYHKMIIGRDYINLGWRSCRISEDIYVKICTNSNGQESRMYKRDYLSKVWGIASTLKVH